MQLAVAAGGAALGGVAGGLIPGVGVMLGIQMGFLGGALLGGILFPNEQDVGGPSRDDVRLSSAATGRFIPIPYGVVRLGGQYLWVDEPVFVTKSERVGKGGGTNVESTELYLTWASGICEGPIAAVTRIWLDDELIFDITAGNTGASLSHMLLTGEGLPPSTSFDGTQQSLTVAQFGPIRIYLGTEDQPAEPLMQIDERIGAAFGGEAIDVVPPFAGLAYAVFERIPGKAVNNHFPQVEFEVLTKAIDVTVGEDYTPVPSVDLSHPLADWSTHVDVRGDTDDGAIYIWNTNDKNPNDPTVIRFTDSLGNQPPAHSAKDMMLPENIGVWRDPNLTVLGISGGGDSRLVAYSLKTGVQLAGQRIISIPAPQPVRAYYWPETEFPSHAVLVYEGTDTITTVPLDLPEDLDATRPQLDGPPIPGTNISTASFPGDPGFVGPDGLLYMIVGEANNSELVIVAFEVLTLEIKRVLRPYRTSPDSSDPFYFSCRMTYDRQHDKIILLSAAGFLRKIDRAALTIDPEPDLALGITFAFNRTTHPIKRGPYNGKLWVNLGLADDYREVDVVSMTVTDRSFNNATSTYQLATIENHNPGFDPLNNGLWVRGGSFSEWLGFIPLDRKTNDCPTAAEIAEDISERCEIGSDLRDTASWTQRICGYLIGRRISGRKALEPLAGAINGDYRTEDGQVEFIKLDTASVKTIPSDDLGAAETLDSKVPGRDIRRPYERELPARVDVQFIDRRMDYASNTQGFDRPFEGFKGRSRETVQMPIVFDDSSDPTPAEIAERLLYAFDANRETHRLQLSWRHLDLNVGDAFQYTRNGRTHLVRCEKWALTDNNKVVIDAKSEDVSIAAGSGETSVKAVSIFEPPALSVGSTSELFLLDSTLLRDVDDGGTSIPIYAAAAPSGRGSWPGAALLRSDDEGVTWKIVDSFAPDQAVAWGLAETALPDARTGVVDRVNSLTVNMRHGSLAGSVSESDLDSDRELNALLVGAAGRWEVLRFRTSVDLTGSPDASGDRYLLSNLRRGQRGTQHNTGSHQVGDTVIALDTAKILRVGLETSELNVARLYKAVTFGQPESLVSAQSFTLGGETKKPWTVAHVEGSRNAATGDWSVTWVRRTRVSGAWVDYVGPPLGEASEAYELDVLDAAGGSVVLTKTGLTAPSAILTQAELADAGLGSGSPNDDMVSPFALVVKVYQISASVGRGNSQEVTLTSPSPGS